MATMEWWKGVAFAAYSPSQQKIVWCSECVDKRKIRTSWWYDWGVGNSRVCTNCGATTVPKDDPTFIPMSFNGTENIAGVVNDRPPGSYYLILNEPELQEISAFTAAERYFAQYRAIKAKDPTAKVGGIGLVIIRDPAVYPHLRYLHRFLDRLSQLNDSEGGLDAKLDFYAVHAYYIGGAPCVLPGCGAAPLDGSTRVTFEHLQDHLIWLHGTLASLFSPIVTSSTPVWITETGALEEAVFNSQARVIDRFLNPLNIWLDGWGFDTGKVARVAWFTTYDDGRPNMHGHLYNASCSELSSVGIGWRQGTNLVVNGYFEESHDGWEEHWCDASIVGGGEVGNCVKLRITTQGHSLVLRTSFPLPAGNYRFEFAHKFGNAHGCFWIGGEHNPDIYDSGWIYDVAWTVRGGDFHLDSSRMIWIQLHCSTQDANKYTYFDEILLRKLRV